MVNSLMFAEQYALHLCACGNILDARGRSIRCRSCANRLRKGIPQKKKPKKNNTCACGAIIKTRTHFRCRSCGNKARKGKYHCNANANNPLWKGNSVGSTGLHAWIRTHKPKTNKCEICDKEARLDCANISGNYLRDINDFQWLCRKCHMLSDGRMNNLKQYKIVKGNEGGSNES